MYIYLSVIKIFLAPIPSLSPSLEYFIWTNLVTEMIVKISSICSICIISPSSVPPKFWIYSARLFWIDYCVIDYDTARKNENFASKLHVLLKYIITVETLYIRTLGFLFVRIDRRIGKS